MQHSRQHGVNAIVSAVQIRSHQQSPIIGRKISNRPLTDIEAGVVDQEVNGTQCFLDAADQLLDLVFLSDVGGMKEKPTGGRERFGGPVQSDLLAARDGHTGAVLQEGSSDGQADAAAAAGDQGGLVGESGHDPQTAPFFRDASRMLRETVAKDATGLGRLGQLTQKISIASSPPFLIWYGSRYQCRVCPEKRIVVFFEESHERGPSSPTRSGNLSPHAAPGQSLTSPANTVSAPS